MAAEHTELTPLLGGTAPCPEPLGLLRGMGPDLWVEWIGIAISMGCTTPFPLSGRLSCGLPLVLAVTLWSPRCEVINLWSWRGLPNPYLWWIRCCVGAAGDFHVTYVFLVALQPPA